MQDEIRKLWTRPVSNSRPVKAPWLLCQAARYGLNTLVFQATAHDRSGLLLHMVSLVQKFDPTLWIDAIYGLVRGDFFFANLLVHSEKANAGKLNALVHAVHEFGRVVPEGWHTPSAYNACWQLSGKNRCTLVQEVLSLLKEYEISVDFCDGQCRVEFSDPNADILTAAQTPPMDGLFDLALELQFPSTAKQAVDEIQNRLRGLGLELKVKG